MAVIGCGSGALAYLRVLDVATKRIVLSNDELFPFPGDLSISADLRKAWLIEVESDESAAQIVRYQLESGTRKVLYSSDSLAQSDGSRLQTVVGLRLAPDESTLAFRSHAPGGVIGIHVIGSGGGLPTVLARSTRIGRLESWSPDGRYVVASLDRTRSSRLWFLGTRGQRSFMFSDRGANLLAFLAWQVPF